MATDFEPHTRRGGTSISQTCAGRRPGRGSFTGTLPCREWFDAQPREYREAVLPRQIASRVVVEAAATFGWESVAGVNGVVLGIDEFGLSAPAADALRARGMTTERVVSAVRTVVANAETCWRTLPRQPRGGVPWQ